MSKELTEQLRNGTLPENWYYIHLKSDWGNIDCITINYCDEDGVFEEYPDEDIKEVLAPVPSYDQFVELTEKVKDLEQDNKCLKSGINTYESQLSIISEQLKEANEVIKFYSDAQALTEEEKQMTAEKYHLVYGLKANDYLERYDVK